MKNKIPHDVHNNARIWCCNSVTSQDQLGLSTCLRSYHHQWNENDAILMTFSSLASPEVVNITTSSAASFKKLFKMTFIRFTDALYKWTLLSVRQDIFSNTSTH